MLRRKRKLQNFQIIKLQNRSRSRGYILITLMLFLSLLAIAALAVLPDMVFQAQRDREEELIHRGLAYSRGIRRFYKKFGRYPAKIEDLENTNTLRFIRKHYKDPVTGQDFKILRLGDPALAMLGQLPRLASPGAAGGGLPSPSTPGSNPTLATGSQTPVTNTDTANAAAGDAGNSNSSVSSSSSSNSSSSTQQVFGGGPILGVVSTDKGKTIREFCSKSHYKDWLFIYDPASDRGGTLNTPWCPGLNIPGINTIQPAPAGSPSPPNTGAPGTVPPTQNQPNPGSEMPPEQ